MCVDCFPQYESALEAHQKNNIALECAKSNHFQVDFNSCATCVKKYFLLLKKLETRCRKKMLVVRVRPEAYVGLTVGKFLNAEQKTLITG